MNLHDLNLEWGTLTREVTSRIEHKPTRLLLNELGTGVRPGIDTHIYLCSDARNEVLRCILQQIQGVAAYNTAGGMIYNPHNVASIVIAHGCKNGSGCGAVHYAQEHKDDPYPELKAIAELVDGDPISNAKRQLEKVPKQEQAGVLYFDHAEGRIMDSSHNETYARAGTRIKIFEEIRRSLEGWYSNGEIHEFAVGQNPDIVLLSNVHGIPSRYNVFQIDFQQNAWGTPIRDSLYYAMSHALRGNGSFKNTSSTIVAFQENRGLPTGIEDFLNSPEQKFLKDYLHRGGSIHFAVVGNQPSHKSIYKVSMK